MNLLPVQRSCQTLSVPKLLLPYMHINFCCILILYGTSHIIWYSTVGESEGVCYLRGSENFARSSVQVSFSNAYNEISLPFQSPAKELSLK